MAGAGWSRGKSIGNEESDLNSDPVLWERTAETEEAIWYTPPREAGPLHPKPATRQAPGGSLKRHRNSIFQRDKMQEKQEANL